MPRLLLSLPLLLITSSSSSSSIIIIIIIIIIISSSSSSSPRRPPMQSRDAVRPRARHGRGRRRNHVQQSLNELLVVVSLSTCWLFVLVLLLLSSLFYVSVWRGATRRRRKGAKARRRARWSVTREPAMVTSLCAAIRIRALLFGILKTIIWCDHFWQLSNQVIVFWYTFIQKQSPDETNDWQQSHHMIVLTFRLLWLIWTAGRCAADSMAPSRRAVCRGAYDNNNNNNNSSSSSSSNDNISKQ